LYLTELRHGLIILENFRLLSLWCDFVRRQLVKLVFSGFFQPANMQAPDDDGKRGAERETEEAWRSVTGSLFQCQISINLKVIVGGQNNSNHHE